MTPIDALILGGGCFWFGIFMTLARDAWHASYNDNEIEQATWDGKPRS